MPPKSCPKYPIGLHKHPIMHSFMLANEFACTQQQVKACFSAEKLLVMGSHEPLTAVKLVLVCQNPSGGRKPPPEGPVGTLLFGYPRGVPSWGSETPASPWPRSPRRVLAKAPAEHPNGPFFCHFFDRDFRRHGHAGKEPEKRAKKKCQNFVLFWGGPEGGVGTPISTPKSTKKKPGFSLANAEILVPK